MGEHATTGDGVLTSLQLLAAMNRRGVTMAAVAKMMPKYPQLLVNVPGDASRLGPEVAAAVARAAAELGDDGKLLVRPSGTEPTIRLMIQAKDAERGRTGYRPAGRRGSAGPGLTLYPMRDAYEVTAVRAAEQALMELVPEGMLMGRAAAGLAAVCASLLARQPGQVYGARVVVLAGSGDNGGDALYAGARLARRGAAVTAIAPGSRTHAGGADALRAAGGRLAASDAADAIGDADLIIDGLLGIGGQGGLREPFAGLAPAVRAGPPGGRDRGGRRPAERDRRGHRGRRWPGGTGGCHRDVRRDQAGAADRPRRPARAKVALNKLYKHTSMQTTFGVNMVALVDNVPRTLPLQAVIHNYVAHQREVIVRRTKHELSEKEARAHILQGLLIALDNLDAIIELIRASRDREAAREQLVERFELSHIQATAILDLRLSQLTALEADSIKQEHADVTERIAELRAILGDESRVLAVIKEELTEISERFGDERRTEISHSEDEIDIEDLIADQQMVITITQTGYIKSLPLATYRQQQRGGRGVTGMDMKDGDFIEHLFVCSSHDYLLFFSNRGKVYRSKVYELPEASRTAKGRALVNILPLREGERIQAVVSTRDFTETKYLVFATKSGTVKKTEFLAYNTPIKADGIIAINIREDDELLAVRAVDPGEEIIMVSKAGLTVRFAESDARSMGRDTTGVRGMDVGKKGEVIAMDVARDDMDLLVVTEHGYGKRTQIAQYRKTNRGAKGVKTIGLTERKGGLAGALVVRDHQELVFISVGGMVQRTSVGGISQQGRSATGVRVMNLKDEDLVSAVALVVDAGEGEADADAPAPEQTPEPGADGDDGAAANGATPPPA